MDDLSTLHKVLQEMLDYIDSVCKKENLTYSLYAGTVLGSVRHKGFIPWDDDLDIIVRREDYDHFLEVFKKQDNFEYVVQEGNGVDYPLYFSKIRKNNTTFIEKNRLKNKWRNMHQGCYVDIFAAEYAHKNPVIFHFQVIFARILQAQALFLRGYDQASLAKKFFMLISLLFFPFRKWMYNFVVSTKKENARGFSCFLVDGGKVFPLSMFDRTIMGEFEGKYYPIPEEFEKYLNSMYGKDWNIPPSQKEIDYKVHCVFFSESVDYKKYIRNDK